LVHPWGDPLAEAGLGLIPIPNPSDPSVKPSDSQGSILLIDAAELSQGSGEQVFMSWLSRWGRPQAEGRPVSPVFCLVDESGRYEAEGRAELRVRQASPDALILWLDRAAAIRCVTQGLRFARQSAVHSAQQAREIQRLNGELTRQREALYQQVRTLLADLTQAEQRERRRLRDVLHDHLQQLIVAARWRLELLREVLGHPRGADEAEPVGEGQALPDQTATSDEVRPARGSVEHGSSLGQAADPTSPAELLRSVDEVLGQAAEASRSLSAELHPRVLELHGLGEALRWLSQTFEQRHGLKVRVMVGERAEPSDPMVRQLLYEATRELLFNIVKHAGVNQAEVSLWWDRQNICRLRVSDAGRGFEPEPLLNPRQADEGVGGSGLARIAQRLQHLGGQAEVDSQPGKGTWVTLVAPM
jgi:signal transduction histidine kinase